MSQNISPISTPTAAQSTPSPSLPAPALAERGDAFQSTLEHAISTPVLHTASGRMKARGKSNDATNEQTEHAGSIVSGTPTPEASAGKSALPDIAALLLQMMAGEAPSKDSKSTDPGLVVEKSADVQTDNESRPLVSDTTLPQSSKTASLVQQTQQGAGTVVAASVLEQIAPTVAFNISQATSPPSKDSISNSSDQSRAALQTKTTRASAPTFQESRVQSAPREQGQIPAKMTMHTPSAAAPAHTAGESTMEYGTQKQTSSEHLVQGEAISPDDSPSQPQISAEAQSVVAPLAEKTAGEPASPSIRSSTGSATSAPVQAQATPQKSADDTNASPQIQANPKFSVRADLPLTKSVAPGTIPRAEAEADAPVASRKDPQNQSDQGSPLSTATTRDESALPYQRLFEEMLTRTSEKGDARNIAGTGAAQTGKTLVEKNETTTGSDQTVSATSSTSKETTSSIQHNTVNRTTANNENGDALNSMKNQYPLAATQATLPAGSERVAEPRTSSLSLPLPPQMARDIIDQVIKGMSFKVDQTTQEMRVALKPESLGSIVLQVRMEDGHMQARIDVSQPAVKVALEAQINTLRQALQDFGIDVRQLDVFSSSQSSTVADGDGSQRGKFQQRSQRQVGTDDTEDTMPTSRTLGYNTLEIIM